VNHLSKVFIIGGRMFFPVLALGPIVKHLTC
jgi:K+-transporting ATPase A subunit